MTLADTRLGAQQRLSDTAHVLRAARPGMSLADCFELASLRDRRSARLLDLYEESREARGLGPDASSVAAIMAGGLDLRARIKLYCRGPDGKTDRGRIKALLTVNRVWIARWRR